MIYECARFNSVHVTGESGLIGMLVIPRFTRTLKNGHDSTHDATKNEPDSATVELRFRPRPQSTTIHNECFKRFKIVVALSWRRFFKNHHGTSTIHADVSTVLLRIMPMHHDLINRGEP